MSGNRKPDDIISEPQPKWKICIYIRLSREDSVDISRQAKRDRQIKSESVRNQKSILLSWVKEYFEPGSYEIVDFFEDDGLSGTDDMRKNFMRMIQTIEHGEGNCVIVKSLSRAFRNYADQGYYLEEYFPARKIRFISTMDSFVDTYKDSEGIYNLDVPMYGVLNDRFAASTSRAVRRTLDDKRSKGKFIGAFPPWGFLKDPEDRNHLILDPETAPIKIQMKNWILYEGMSLAGVARCLNNMGIPSPAGDKKRKGWNYYNPHIKKKDDLWTGKSVKDVLLTLMNVGCMVQGRQRVVSYKIHDRISVPERDWYIVENTHEATFSKEEYDALCNILRRNTRTADSTGEVHKFAGLLRCGRCKKAMHRSHSRGHIYYKCRTRSEKSVKACSVKSIRQDRLEQAVLSAIQQQIAVQGSMDTVLEEVQKNWKENSTLKWLEGAVADKKLEFQRAQNIYDGLYGDWKSGEISEHEYRRMRKSYREKMSQIEEDIHKMEEDLNCAEEEETGRRKRVSEIFQNKNVKELSRSLLLSLVDTIYIYENSEITIHFRFRDELLQEADIKAELPVLRAQQEQLARRG